MISPHPSHDSYISPQARSTAVLSGKCSIPLPSPASFCILFRVISLFESCQRSLVVVFLTNNHRSSDTRMQLLFTETLVLILILNEINCPYQPLDRETNLTTIYERFSHHCLKSTIKPRLKVRVIKA